MDYAGVCFTCLLCLDNVKAQEIACPKGALLLADPLL